MVVSMDRWQGKVAIVTGASAGIGSVIAEKLVEAGLQVAGFARSLDKMQEKAKKLQSKKGKFHPVKVDMTKPDDILTGFKWVAANLGPVNILINAAGVLPKDSLVDGKTGTWKQVLDINVLGLSIATQEAVKVMRAHDIQGHIVHLNSQAGHYVPNFPGLAMYPGSKHAVTALTETLRQELNHLGLKIKITSVSPGGVETEMLETLFPDPKEREAIKHMAHLKAEDVADAVVYALSTPPHVQVHELNLQAVGAP